MMTKNKVFRFNQSIFSLLVTLALSTTVLQAAEGDEADDNGYEVITVTASKREQGLQQTPIAITVVSEESIDQTKALDMYDLQSIVPTLRVTPLQRSVNTSFSLRGFGNGSNNTGIEPSVGIFIDGVYRSRAASQIGDLPRLDQIEILSGPQSTLFGKNASAGVINVRTKAPSYDLEGKFEGGFGNYNQQVLKAYVTNGINDNLAFSLSAGINTRDGYTDSIVGLSQVNDRDRWNIRGQLLYEPSDDVTLRFIADSSEIDEVCCSVSSYTSGSATLGIIPALGGMATSDIDPFSYESALNEDPVNTVEDSGFSLQLDIDYDSFSFTSITALRNNDSSFSNDVDFSSLDIIQEVARVDIETFTQEFRFTSTGTNKVDWMVGAYIFQEDVDTGDSANFGTSMRSFFDILVSAAAPGLIGDIEGLYGLEPGTFFNADAFAATDYTQANDAYSIFATFDYHVSEKLTTTFGISYTNDEKDITIAQLNTDPLSAIDLGNDPTIVFGLPLADALGAIGTPAPFIPVVMGTLRQFQFLQPMLEVPNSVEDGKTSDSDTTWTLRLAYEMSDSINLFAAASTGFKASSWNLSRDTRPFAASQAALDSAGLSRGDQEYGTRFANPEESKVYEIGMKAQYEKGAFNITLFDQTIEEFQESLFIGTGFVLANAGQQSTKGIEFDSVYMPNDNWTLSLAGTILDPVYDSFVGASGPDGPEDFSGRKPAGVHERSIVAGVKYDFELENGVYGYIRSDYIYESEALLVGNLPDELTREVSTLNASAGLVFNNNVSIQLWARNLNDDEYFMSGFPTPIRFDGSITVYPNQPQTYGVSVAYDF